MSPSDVIKESIQTYLDDIGRISVRPSKKSKQLLIIAYLAQKIPWGRVFTEQQINDLLKMRHTFWDFALLRRELYILEYIDRTLDGSKYTRR